MVVGYFDIARVAVVPFETQTVLAIDANAVLSGAVAFEGFEMVAGWNSQFIEADGCCEQAEFVGRAVFNCYWKFVTRAVPEFLCLLVTEALNHTLKMARRGARRKK